LTSLSSRPIIGIRDSGAGGLTVARQVRRLLPGVSLYYFADTANVPYGDRDPAEIRHFAFSITHFLQDHGANLVIFACNTTSAYALGPARQHFEIPLLGMIEGGAESALSTLATVTTHPRIGILATSATVKSHAYSREIMQRCPNAQCMEIACPRFVPLVETDAIDSAEAFDACSQAMQPLLEQGVDAVVLGCTHFPLLLPTLQKVAPEITFIDPALGVAQQTARLIKSTFDESTLNQHDGTEHYYASGSAEILQHWIAKLMPPSHLPQIHQAPVFSLNQKTVEMHSLLS